VDPWIAAAVFVATYALIASERIDRTIVALLGGALMIVLGVIDQEEGFGAVDLEVILLLAAMMVMAGILSGTGFFQWVAIRAVRAVGASPMALLLVLATVTAVLSAFLDNVTTVVLIAPVTIYVAAVLRVSPIPFLVSQILASNIGGTATLIGDPPNILIGSAAGLDFLDFVLVMTPIAVIIFGVFLVMARWQFARGIAGAVDGTTAVEGLVADEVITDRSRMLRSLAVLGATIVGFLLASPLGLEPATVALLGAAILMLVVRADPIETLREVEWPTIAFFVGLFILVEGIVAVGIIDAVAEIVLDITGGDQTATTIGLLWLSAVVSAIIDNIPYTATMIPVVEALGEAGLEVEPLWWALALGACLGGNATLIGASANVVVAGVAARAGHRVAFGAFLRFGIPVTVMSIAISTVYLWVRFLA
jgi:Na+/H+ antiporter NhaD/arsenite permease-like protein